MTSQEIKNKVSEAHYTYLSAIAAKHSISSLGGICGVYMIEAPDGQKYVGGSTNIKRRWGAYRGSIIKQGKLMDSFRAHGVVNHKFSVLELCTPEALREREAYYGIMHDVLENGLNAFLPKSIHGNPACSSEVRQRTSVRFTGRKLAPYIIEKNRERMKGSKLSPETVEKLRIINTGRKHSTETLGKMRQAWHGRSKEEQDENVRRMQAARKDSGAGVEHCKKLAEANRKPLLDFSTGIFYEHIGEAASVYKCSTTQLRKVIYGIAKTDKYYCPSSLQYV